MKIYSNERKEINTYERAVMNDVESKEAREDKGSFRG